MFYKSLSSGDDNGEDKDIQKDNETDKYVVDMRDMVDKDKDMVDMDMVDMDMVDMDMVDMDMVIWTWWTWTGWTWTW